MTHPLKKMTFHSLLPIYYTTIKRRGCQQLKKADTPEKEGDNSVFAVFSGFFGSLFFLGYADTKAIHDKFVVRAEAGSNGAGRCEQLGTFNESSQKDPQALCIHGNPGR